MSKAAQEVRPSGFLDVRAFLESLYNFLKQANGQYSYLRFAEDLGSKATTVMHQIVRGYRPLTGKAGLKIAKALGLSGLEKRYFLTLVDYCSARGTAKREELFERLLTIKNESLPDDFDKDCLAFYSEWYHPVVRELVATPGFKADPAWIAKRIQPNIRPEQARQSLELLQRLELVSPDPETKKLVQTKTRMSTGHRVKGMALLSYHQQMILLARDALTRVEGRRRDISAITVNVDEATAQRLKSLIHAFQLQLLDEAEKAGVGDQVYQVNIQLFPFTGEDD